jgi:hypothetical protein
MDAAKLHHDVIKGVMLTTPPNPLDRLARVRVL